jgi:hypothetical protein
MAQGERAFFGQGEAGSQARMSIRIVPSSTGTSRTAGHFYPDLNQGDSDD